MRTRIAGLALLLTALAVPASGVVSTPVVLGADGTAYRVWSGTFGEIFGASATYAPETPILALDVTPTGQSYLRYLVPGTEGPETESSPVAIFDARANALHLVWTARVSVNLTSSRFYLRSYSSGGWSPLLELSAYTLAEKSSLRLALSEDSYRTTVAGVERQIARRVLHLVWTETAGETVRAFYSPVLFLDGAYVGWNPVVALDDLTLPAEPSAIPVGADLRQAPTLTALPDGRVSISFVGSTSGRLVAVELQPLPGELGQLAEMARGHIVELAQTVGTTDRATLAQLARGHIVELAGRFHPSAAAYLGQGTGDLLLSAAPGADGLTLGELARGHIVELGREILAGGVANVCAGQGWLIEVPPLVPTEGTDFSHYFSARQISSWELPSDLVAGARVFLSLDGERAVLAWQNGDRVYYRETTPEGGWSDLRSLDPTLVSLAEAWSAVERRALGF